jgi:hypothetical protein
MTDIERKAQAMLNDARDAHVNPDDYLVGYTALCRAIEQHEAFRKEVSDAVVDYFGPKHLDVILAGHLLSRFIIPAPKPDPLIEVLRSVGGDDRDYCDYDIYVKEIRAALEARGLEIREKNK